MSFSAELNARETKGVRGLASCRPNRAARCRCKVTCRSRFTCNFSSRLNLPFLEAHLILAVATCEFAESKMKCSSRELKSDVAALPKFPLLGKVSKDHKQKVAPSSGVSRESVRCKCKRKSQIKCPSDAISSKVYFTSMAVRCYGRAQNRCCAFGRARDSLYRDRHDGFGKAVPKTAIRLILTGRSWPRVAQIANRHYYSH